MFDGMTFDIKHKPFKRLFDIIFSCLVLAILAPLMLCIALAIKLSSRGCIFYTHQRIGRTGRPFICYRFRSSV